MPDVAFDSQRHAQVSDDMSAGGGRTNHLRNIGNDVGDGANIRSLDD